MIRPLPCYGAAHRMGPMTAPRINRVPPHNEVDGLHCTSRTERHIA
jgi:hypothetical protein